MRILNWVDVYWRFVTAEQGRRDRVGFEPLDDLVLIALANERAMEFLGLTFWEPGNGLVARDRPLSDLFEYASS